MSRYEKISTEIDDMKELIIAINKRFDQVYKKFDILDEKVDALNKRFDSLEEKFDKRFNELVNLVKEIKK